MRNLQNQKTVLRGEANGLIVMSTVLGLLLFIGVVSIVWITISFLDLKTNQEIRLKANADAVRLETTQKLEADFAEREQKPYEAFVGPDDLGRVSFTYPKTWSIFINKDAQPYEAYFHPRQVRPINSNSRYAMRLLIEDSDYTKVLSKYDSLLKSGKLRQSVVTINGQQSTKYEGQFSDRITGTAVIFKIRDKTVTIRTDIDETYKDQFNKIIESLTFKD